jgi:hypothetical protein
MREQCLIVGDFMRERLLLLVNVTMAAFAATVPAASAELRIGAWNIANLHHEENVPLRERAQPRDAEDFQRLREYTASLWLDIVATA